MITTKISKLWHGSALRLETPYAPMITGFSFTPLPSGYMIDFTSRDVSTAINSATTEKVALKLHPVEYAPRTIK